MSDTRSTGAVRAKSNRRYSVKKRKRRRIITTIIVFVVIVLLLAGTWCYFRFRTFSGYKVQAELDLANSDERTVYKKCGKGYLKCAGDGITFFDSKGVIWAETYEMTQPLLDVCGEYSTVADLKGSDVYIYDGSGLVNRLSVSQPILEVEISKQGVVAVATNDGTSNYITVMDKEGTELITAKSVFSSSGYLMDISLSEDGSALAAAFLYISEGTLQSKVVFYDFTGEGGISAGFNQYQDTVITTVEFINANTVCAVGDNAFTIYRVQSVPEIIYEDLNLQWEIQSLFFGESKVGLVVEDESNDSNYTIKVFNASGTEIVSQGTDFAFTNADFAGNHVLLYSANDCEMYSFWGIKRFTYTFDERIEYLLSCGNGTDFVYAMAEKTQFIQLK